MKPVRHFIIISVLLLFSFLSANAIPARRGKIVLRQPDGTEFTAILRGDEFLRLLTTADGNAIIQESDGYYCYAVYGPDGKKTSTGHKVGTDVTASIQASSKNIPYQALMTNASKHKNSIRPDGREPLMKRMNGVYTKSESASADVKHGIVILAQFKKDENDRYAQFTTPEVKTGFENLLKEKGYTGPDGQASGCAKDYFEAQFEGRYDFDFDVFGPITLEKNKSYYGGNGSDDMDQHPHKMIIEACKAADSDADFSIYDDDKDGEVDNVYVFFAGGDEAQGAGNDCIWSHAWYIGDGAGEELQLDGVKINRYACSSELRLTSDGVFSFTGIGTFCHEYSHTLGLPDLYDTDYSESGGRADALWYSTSLMDGGGYNNNGNTPPNFNAIEREMLGLADIVDLEVREEQWTISPVGKGKTIYRIQGNVSNEYYLIECRNTAGWDKHIYEDNSGRGIGTGTMLAYHVDKSGNTAGKSGSYNKILTATERWQYNEVNANPVHQCADLIEAGGDKVTSVRNVFFPQSDVSSFTPRFWNREYSDKTFTDIVGNSDGSVSFTVKETGISTDETLVAFQDKIIVSWTAKKGTDNDSHIRIGTKVFDVSPVNGIYSIVIGGLEYNRDYTAEIYFEDETTAETIKFKTGKYRDGSYPFIFLKKAARNSDGSFKSGTRIPLMLYNAPGLDEAGISWIADAPTDGSLTWYFNDNPIERGEDGYYTITESGTLKAVATYEGDTTDVIVKEITVK